MGFLCSFFITREFCVGLAPITMTFAVGVGEDINDTEHLTGLLRSSEWLKWTIHQASANEFVVQQTRLRFLIILGE